MYKYLIALGIILLSCNLLPAQSGLTFNQVLKISSTEDTVPAGRVWKVEAYFQSQSLAVNSWTSSSCSSGYIHPFWVDGQYYYHVEGGVGTGNTTRYINPGNRFPMWLPAGTRLRTNCPNDFLSVIEFVTTP